MRKLLQVIVMSVFFTGFVNAQSVKFGFKGGANYSSLNIQGFDSKNLTSYHLGAILEIKTPIIGVQPELLYSSQGAQVNGFSDFNLNYVAIPIALKFYFTKLSFDVGPQFSYLVNDNLPQAVNSNFKKSDIGVFGGFSLNIIGGVFAQARYIVGVTNNTDNGGGRNNVFQLSMGYKF